MNDILAGVGLSPRRNALCSRLNAQRVAGRLLDRLGQPMAVISTGNPLQPFRVANCSERGSEGRVVVEVRT